MTFMQYVNFTNLDANIGQTSRRISADIDDGRYGRSKNYGTSVTTDAAADELRGFIDLAIIGSILCDASC